MPVSGFEWSSTGGPFDLRQERFRPGAPGCGRAERIHSEHEGGDPPYALLTVAVFGFSLPAWFFSSPFRMSPWRPGGSLHDTRIQVLGAPP